jgi:hypothetical protein
MNKPNVFTMKFDLGTIKHLGLQMYSTLPPVIGELVSNAWDADASNVSITIPTTPMVVGAEIIIQDDGYGMSDADVQNAYLVIGRDRRKEVNDAPTSKGRKVMGRKGIGKFSAFGIASEIEIETVKAGAATRFVLRYKDFEQEESTRTLKIPAEEPTGCIAQGTRIVLRGFTKYQTRAIDIQSLRRGIARRFSIIGEEQGFSVSINEEIISPEERDLTRLLDKDFNGNLYLWTYDNVAIDSASRYIVSGWIGALSRTNSSSDGIQRGIAVMARGKLVQEPFVFDAMVGQQFALSYLIGELHAEFVDEAVDTIGTARSSLVWDTEANEQFKKWGQDEVNKIAREWAKKRTNDQSQKLEQSSVYKQFLSKTEGLSSRPMRKVADKLIRNAIEQNPTASTDDFESLISFVTDVMEYDVFAEMATEIEDANLQNIQQVINLFKEWEVLEAKEMMRVTDGRIKTIRKLKQLIDTNALEVPTIHEFLRKFPWVLDPRWNLISDEKRFSSLLKERFPESVDTLEADRRIDFLCVAEGETIVVVEIKRPEAKANEKSLKQIEDYVGFMRDHILQTTDKDVRMKEVVGYLLVGGSVDKWEVRQKISNLKNSKIYVRLYADLLVMVERYHDEFLKRYGQLKDRKMR